MRRLKPTLEILLDQYTMQDVLDALAQIAEERAASISNGDPYTHSARRGWESAAQAIRICAETAGRAFV